MRESGHTHTHIHKGRISCEDKSSRWCYRRPRIPKLASKPPEIREETGNRFFLTGFRRSQPWREPVFRFLASRTMQPQILIVSAIQLMLRAKSLQSCLTLWDSMDCSPPGSSVYGILQARILEYAHLQGMFPTQGSNQCHLQLLHCKWILYHWATREALSLWHLYNKLF